MKERTGNMIALSIALIVCAVLLCFKGIKVDYKYTYIETFQEVKQDGAPMGFQTDEQLQEDQDNEKVPTMDDMGQAIQDVIGGIEDGEE